MEDTVENLIVELYHDYGTNKASDSIRQLERVEPQILRQVLSKSPFIQRIKQRYEHCTKYLKEGGIPPYFMEIVHGYKRNFKCTKSMSEKIIGYWELLKTLFEKCSLNRGCSPGNVCNLDRSICIPHHINEVTYTLGDKIITGSYNTIVQKIQQHFESNIDYSQCSHGILKDKNVGQIADACNITKILAFMDSNGRDIYCEDKNKLIVFWNHSKPLMGLILTPADIVKIKQTGAQPYQVSNFKREFYQLSPDLPNHFLMKVDIENIINLDHCIYVLIPMNHIWLDNNLQSHVIFLPVSIEKKELDINDLDLGALQL